MVDKGFYEKIFQSILDFIGQKPDMEYLTFTYVEGVSDDIMYDIDKLPKDDVCEFGYKLSKRSAENLYSLIHREYPNLKSDFESKIPELTERDNLVIVRIEEGEEEE